MIENPGPRRICGVCAHQIRSTTLNTRSITAMPDPTPPADLTVSDADPDDAKKAAEALSVENDGADVTIHPPIEMPPSSTILSLLVAVPGVGEKTALSVLDENAVDRLTMFVPEQVQRANSRPAGLSGRALATYVLTGAGITDQIKTARAKAPVAPPKPRRTTPAKAKASPPPAGATRPLRARYPADITDAVKLAKAARGTSAGAPGAKQHVLARQVIADGKFLPADHPKGRSAIGLGDVTVAHVIDASGAKSLAKLRRMADGTGSKMELKEIAPLARAIPDPFCSGRNLASILVAWVDQIKAAK